ncbi:uncharacterized protein PGTG_20976 [Puccinia graminis f. sp. tritici CRL 75-36-700-3]|uniref:No apical meristem-associated C-terminal domain-containing protein n=1 Tax=Puccinia graminis f. sp. tritici (strain CRL 75-36-700-3 / race SCCL) TaxID=418459 RepID=H6QPZ1_PUCGT|nr:uncharacterized protein PGTG_20976 [Puccinia graminis f. sp. tritici CRL 75-36-700-3]EHS64514.1 hypothetical protein PGTG_20976 [Puccinia graminis f. sp. tritici CRL 75-36-700-3]
MKHRRVVEIITINNSNDPEDNNENKQSGQKKTSNYSEQEDVELCRAWVQISEDPVVGTNQEGSTFWVRIEKLYREATPNSPSRPVGSIKSRWALLQKSINKFRGCVVQVESFNASGTSAEDQLNRALRLFTEDQKCSFKHLRCYNLLVRSPKWNQYIRDNERKAAAAKRKRAVTPTPVAEVAPSTPSASNTRGASPGFSTPAPSTPAGSNAASERRPKPSFMIATQSKIQTEILGKDSESLKLMAESGALALEAAIMTRDLTGLDHEQREFFMLKRRDIVSALRARVTANATSAITRAE